MRVLRPWDTAGLTWRASGKQIRTLIEFLLPVSSALLQEKQGLWEVSLGPVLFPVRAGEGTCAAVFILSFPFLWVWLGKGGRRQRAQESLCVHPFIRWNNVYSLEQLWWIVSDAFIMHTVLKLLLILKAVVMPDGPDCFVGIMILWVYYSQSPKP